MVVMMKMMVMVLEDYGGDGEYVAVVRRWCLKFMVVIECGFVAEAVDVVICLWCWCC